MIKGQYDIYYPNNSSSKGTTTYRSWCLARLGSVCLGLRSSLLLGGGSSGLLGGALCGRLLGLLLSLLLGGGGGGGLLRSSSLGRGSLLFPGGQHKVSWHHTFQKNKR